MKAMILAAGEGTRLHPLTLAVPKPLIPIANTPLLARTLRLLADQKIDDIAVNLSYLPDLIREALGDGSAFGAQVTYSEETSLLGTAGGTKRMEAFFEETFLVLYGDNLYQTDFAPIIAFHRANNALATIATFTTSNPTACGLVETDAAGRVTRFQEKPKLADVFTDQANAGVYVLEPEIFSFIPLDTFYDFGSEVFPALLEAAPDRVFAQPLGGYLRDTGTLESYRQANWDVLTGCAGESTVGISPDAKISPYARIYGRNIIGARTHVDFTAHIRNSIIWDDCRIEPAAFVNGAILGNGVEIGMGAFVHDGAVLANGVHVRRGARVAAGSHVPPGEVVQ